jgi:multimeric flavodoxin WrbA
MKIALLNGSPKMKNSASSFILEDLEALINNQSNEVIRCELHKAQINENQKEELYGCDALVFIFPLYVDGIPSHLLYSLESLQEYFNAKPSKQIKVYTAVNCGFYEGKQNEIAIETLKNWAHRAGLLWGQGLGIGGGGMLASVKSVPLGQGPKKNLGKAFHELVPNILNGKSGDSIYITPNIPRFLYMAGGNMGWRSQIKSNGLTAKDLFRQK